MTVAQARGAALVRIAIGAIFIAEGFAKLTGEFVRGGFAKAAQQAAREAWPFWRSFLQGVVVPNSEAFGWVFAFGELAVGIGLLLGFLTRIAAGGGMALMLAILLNDSYAGPGASWNKWVTAGLPAKFAFLLFALLLAVDAGRVWGLDARLKKGFRSSRRT